MKSKKIYLVGLMTVVFVQSNAKASPSAAENDAYEMAVRQVQAGFTIFPGASGNLQSNEKTAPLLMPVTAGVTYTFLVGVDERVSDLDLYVYDEQGNEILVDDRRERRAGTKFVATYTGTAKVTVLMNSLRLNRSSGKFHGIGSWALLVGTRGGSTQERRSPVGPGVDQNENAKDTQPTTDGGI